MAQTKERRGVVSAQRRRDLVLLTVDLQMLQAKYPLLRLDIQDNIDGHLRQADRTREADRGAVLAVIDDWQDVGLTIQEITDDTGLSDRVIRFILDELLSAELVGVREEAQAGKHGRRAKNYFSLKEKAVTRAGPG